LNTTGINELENTAYITGGAIAVLVILMSLIKTPDLVYSLQLRLSPDDINESRFDITQTQINTISKYCYANAERVSLGMNVIPELVKAGVVSNFYSNITCNETPGLLTQAEIVHENAEKELLQQLSVLKSASK
jgi:hypothetical protein